jgi:hypothetical protein
MDEHTTQDNTEGSQAPPPEREIIFHYSREHRLAKASSRVQELNDPKAQRRSGIFGTFTSTRSHTVLLVSIIGMCVFISFISKLTKEKSAVMIGGNSIHASASRMEEGTTYLTIKKTFKKDSNVYTGAVDLAVTPLVSRGKEESQEGAQEAPISTHRIFFTLKPEEEYGLFLPFEASTLLILMQAEDKHITFRVKPK